MWRRIVNLIMRRPCPARAAAVDALFAENLSAHERAGRAADDVIRSSQENQQQLQGLRDEIAERTDAERRSRFQPRTSDVRAMVEDVLNRPSLRGQPSNRDQS